MPYRSFVMGGMTCWALRTLHTIFEFYRLADTFLTLEKGFFMKRDVLSIELCSIVGYE